MAKNIKLIHAFEQLGAIDQEKDEEKKKKMLKEYGKVPPLNYILSLNFNSTVNLDLPEGMPPLDLKDMDAHTHPDFMGMLSANISRLRHCTTESNLKRIKKENIFYEILINCPIKDAEIVCAAKDKSLGELYPSITPELIKSVFPGVIKE